jgi:hypothetical protein
VLLQSSVTKLKPVAVVYVAISIGIKWQSIKRWVQQLEPQQVVQSQYPSVVDHQYQHLNLDMDLHLLKYGNLLNLNIRLLGVVGEPYFPSFSILHLPSLPLLANDGACLFVGGIRSWETSSWYIILGVFFVAFALIASLGPIIIHNKIISGIQVSVVSCRVIDGQCLSLLVE